MLGRSHHGAMEAMSTIPKNEVMYVHLLKLYLDEIGAMKSLIAISKVNTTTENACQVRWGPCHGRVELQVDTVCK